mmetsp:Transcript_38293/g.43159  ORF Transcript_38293/g.43159 Transcript_38293/m.43159 type:complete len:90 (+) Transcript_38293:559-828(+)
MIVHHCVIITITLIIEDLPMCRMYFDLDENYDPKSHVLRSFVGNRGGMKLCFESNISGYILIPFTTYNNNKQQQMSDGGYTVHIRVYIE